jgi:hypothetical protein
MERNRSVDIDTAECVLQSFITINYCVIFIAPNPFYE